MPKNNSIGKTKFRGAKRTIAGGLNAHGANLPCLGNPQWKLLRCPNK